MQPLQRRALLLALIVTMTLTALLMYYIEKQSSEVIPMTQVVTAIENIPPKTLIQANQLEEITIAQDLVIPGAISDKNQVSGKISRENIFVGEQIIRQRLVQGVKEDGLAAIIPPGFRAITISVSPTSGVASNIRTGNFVDILVFLKKPYADQEIVKTILQKVEVIQISGGNKSSEGNLLTLSLSPEDCETLFLIEELGDIKLTLRAIIDNKIVTLPGTTICSIN